MAMINIVTGHTGVDHVTSDDDRHFNAAIVGNGDFILEGGNGWEPSIIGANSVRVASGEAAVQGCHIRSAEPVEIILEVGTSGYKRNDLIGIRYLNVGGIESAELTVVKGTPTTSTPVDPSYIAEDILNGGEERFAPLIRAVFNGTAIASVSIIANTIQTLVNKGVCDALSLNDFIATPNAWVDINLANNINNYRFLGFSFTTADHPPAEHAMQVAIPVEQFKLTGQGGKYVNVVNDPWGGDQSKCVYVCYKDDTTVQVYRGTNVYGYYRFNAVGIK